MDVDNKGEPWFCAKDVCCALGYNNSRDAVRRHVEMDDVVKNDTIDSMSRKQQVIFINESGLYSLIFTSKLDSAKRFKHWVTSDVLPAIRKRDAFVANNILEYTEKKIGIR